MLSEDVLAALLKKFYYGVRTKKGELYSRSGFKGLRAGLQRRLEGKPFYRTFNIAHDRQFNEANQVYLGYLARLKKTGLDRTTHKKIIHQADVKKLYEHVFTNTPQGLSYRVFYEIMLHFGRRGREGLRDLSKDFLELKTDANGREYFAKRYNELDKNHRENRNEDCNDGIITSIPGHPD